MSSFFEAPPLKQNASLPVVVYAHGLGGWMSENTALLEEIASHGYAVFSVGSPGFARGLQFPNMDTVSLAYPEFRNPQNATPHPLAQPFTDDLQVRLDRYEVHLKMALAPRLYPRRLDDMLAAADFLNGNNSELIVEPDQVRTGRDLVSQLLPTGINSLVYMGYSYGGAAAGGAAKADSRANGAINLDGQHQGADLLGKTTRVPYLTFRQNAGQFPFYNNEFFFEPFETMGTDPNVIRIRMPTNITHSDFNDLVHFEQTVRTTFLGLPNPVDGENVFTIIKHICLAFINKVSGVSDESWDVSESFALFPDISPINVSYVAEWAANIKGANKSNDNDEGQNVLDDINNADSASTSILGNWFVTICVTTGLTAGLLR